jgi:YVTN family beta-propeller protein
VALGQYLEAVVPTGDSPGELIWSRVWNKVYCSNTQDASITVISGESNQVLTTIQVGDYPGYLSLNSDESKLYCTRTEDENRLVIIDVGADTILKTLSIPNRPGPMAYNATMDKMYISCNDDPVYRIVVLDATADTISRYIPARGVGRLLWHPVTNRVFSCGSDTIRVIDCLTDEIAVRMQGGGTTWCYNPVNERVYLGARHSVNVLTPYGDSVIAVVPGDALSVSAAPFPNKVYSTGGGVVRVIDGSSNQILDSLVVGGGWTVLVTDLVKERVYCSNTNAHKVDIIDARADTLIKTIPLGRSPEVLCWNRTNSRVYITDFMDNVVYVIRDTTTGISEADPIALKRARLSSFVRRVLSWSDRAPGTLIDMTGRRVLTLKLGTNDLTRLAPGVYVTVGSGSGEVRRVVKVE